MARPKVFKLAAIIRINVGSRLSDIVLSCPTACTNWSLSVVFPYDDSEYRTPLIRHRQPLQFYLIFFNPANIRTERI